VSGVAVWQCFNSVLTTAATGDRPYTTPTSQSPSLPVLHWSPDSQTACLFTGPQQTEPNDRPSERTNEKKLLYVLGTSALAAICGRAGSGCFSLRGGGHENVADLRRVSVRAGEKNLTHWSFTATHFSPRNREERVDGVPVPRPYISPYCMRSGCRRPEA